MSIRLQPLTRGKVAALGEPGRAWHAALPDVLDDLARTWGLTLGRALPGGSASYVCGAQTADGEPRVVKVVVPDPELVDEAPVLLAAAGRGHVLLHDHAPAHRALLLERLGPSLEASRPPVLSALDTLADTLLAAWRPPAAGDEPAPDRAADLAATLLARQHEHGDPCDRAALREALAAAERLSAGDDPAGHVVLHGDPHPGNALRVLHDRPGAPAGHVLVDPDGLRGDPAYDVGVTLRDWTGRLEGSEARSLLDGWVRHAARRTDLDPGRVADWAHLERVSTGLYLVSLGADRLARRFFDSAAALVS